MLKFTVELWPHGQESNRSVLLHADVWNDGTGNYEVGNYGYKVYESKWRRKRMTFTEGEIKGYPRQEGVAGLIALVLADTMQKNGDNYALVEAT